MAVDASGMVCMCEDLTHAKMSVLVWLEKSALSAMLEILMYIVEFNIQVRVQR